jgi:hypothetical protein
VLLDEQSERRQNTNCANNLRAVGSAQNAPSCCHLQPHDEHALCHDTPSISTRARGGGSTLRLSYVKSIDL